MFTLDAYFTTDEFAFTRMLNRIEPSDLIEVKLTATPYSVDGDTRVEYGFLIIHRVVKD